MRRYFILTKYLFPLFLVGIFFVVSRSLAQTSVVEAIVDVSICGNFILEGGEECDNYDFDGQSCTSLGYDAGDIDCNPDCTIDDSACYNEENDDTPPPSGGGGGGGGTVSPPQTSVTFSGWAYPLSEVTILKDGQIALITIAGPDARFSGSLTSLSQGNYNFSVYGEDSQNMRSILFTFNVYVTEGAGTRISGIFLAPTISTDRSSVRLGDNISIFGQTVPDSQVTIATNSDQTHFNYVASDSDGFYHYDFDTSVLESGDHSTKSKTAYETQVSSYGYSVSFSVGESNIDRETESDEEEVSDIPADINGDNSINLIDFSVAAYWYERPNPPADVDMNKDGKVDIVDFSIMAYYWTG